MKKLVRINSSKLSLSLLLSYALIVLWPPQAFTQSSPSPAWSGSVTCQLNEQETGVFNRQETQTWTLIGGGPISLSGVPTYNATWSVSGQGQLQRIQGAQTTNIQWTTNVPPQPTTLAIFVRGSDNRLIMLPRHSQLRMDNATTGARQVIINGVAQQPTNISHAVWEWQFPHIEASPTDTTVSGSTQTQAEGGDAELLHHFGGPPPIAVCQWQLTKGGSASSSPNPSQIGGGTQNPNRQPSQNCQSPDAVQQSFETMKADLKSQYDQLIRGTTDPTEIASLSNQEQTMLANLSSQEQRDMTLASQGCLQATNSQGNNSYSGGSPGGAAAPNAGSNPNAGGGPNAGSGSNAGGGASSSNSGSNPNAGGSPNGSTGSSGQMSTPQLVSLSPSSVSQGSTTTVRLLGQGTHWQSQTTNLSFGPQITVQSFTADPTGTSATANITVASNAATGSRPVMLMTGAEMVGLPSGLSVTASTSQQGSGSSGTMILTTPSLHVPFMGMLTGVSPATNNGQASIPVTLTGQLTHFTAGATTVSFVRSSTQLQSGTPTSIVSKLPLVVGGASSATTLQAGPIQVNSNTSATVPLTINPATQAGTYSITVTTPMSSGTETLTLNNAFTVTATPSFSGVNIALGTGIAKNKGSTSSSAAPTSANYLVTITGLLCTTPTTGGGDAVYAVGFVRQYDRRNGQVLMFTDPQTWIYGDVNGMQDQRKQAGSRNSTGGIGVGDFIPPGSIPGIKNSLPPQVNLFPLTLWQGPLSDGVDALVISPSIWENYGDTALLSTWVQNQTSFNNSLMLDSRVQNEINTQALGAVVLGASENAPGSVTQATAQNAANQAYIIATAFGGPSSLGGGLIIEAIISAFDHPTHDRPIGLVNANASSLIFPNSAVVLTREIIEKHLGNNSWATVAIDFKDATSGLTGGDHPGEYTMFIQIERQ